MVPTSQPLTPSSSQRSLFYGYVLPLLVVSQFFGQPTVYDFLSNLNGHHDTKRGEAFLLVASITLFILCTWVRMSAWNAGIIDSRSRNAYGGQRDSTLC